MTCTTVSYMYFFFPGVKAQHAKKSHIISLYWSPYPTSNTICLGDLSPATLCVSSACVTHCLISANSLWEPGSMGMFTVAKMWLIFLDQIEKMTPRVFWLYRWAVCSSSNETRRQRAWSDSLNIDTEQRGTRATSENLKFTVIGNIIQLASKAKSLEATHPRCHLLSQTLLMLLQTGPNTNHTNTSILSHIFLCVELWWDERHCGVFTFQRFTETHCLFIKSSISTHSRADGCLLPAP